jgi:hypothetical protein
MGNYPGINMSPLIRNNDPAFYLNQGLIGNNQYPVVAPNFYPNSIGLNGYQYGANNLRGADPGQYYQNNQYNQNNQGAAETGTF